MDDTDLLLRFLIRVNLSITFGSPEKLHRSNNLN